MSCLDANFTLTPKSPVAYIPAAASSIACHGVELKPYSPWNLSSAYSTDSVFYPDYTAANPSGDYTQWINRVKVPHIEFFGRLTGSTSQQQLALIFGFNCETPGLLSVFSDAAKIIDLALTPDDNQFLFVVDSIDVLFKLYFIHMGGNWHFKGISGYVI